MKRISWVTNFPQMLWLVVCLAACLSAMSSCASNPTTRKALGQMAQARLAFASGVSIPVKINAPGLGLLSVGMYDAAGTLVRSLAYAKEVDAGPQTLIWDATTDLGLPVKPGTYHVRGVWFQRGPKINYRMKVGISGEPPYPIPNGLGEWGANLGSPVDVSSNGQQLVGIFSCVESNYNTGVQLMDALGKIVRRYSTFFPWDVRLAGAMNDKNLYLAIANLNAKRLVIGKYDLSNPQGKILADIPSVGILEPDGRWAGRWTTDVRGLAVSEDRVYVPVLPDNKLFVVNANSGQIVSTVSVTSPRGVATKDGHVYLLSKNQLLQLDRDGRTVGTVIKAGLEDPSSVALDEQGNFYISDRGKAQQVKVFSPQGLLLRRIGVSGGRMANGSYNPKGLLKPRGIALGPNGSLWVTEAEERFQRLSVWDRLSGQLKQEFFNTSISAGQGQVSPERSEMIFTDDDYANAPGISAYKFDLKTASWYPSWSLNMSQSMMQQEDVFLGNTAPNPLHRRTPYLSFAGNMVKADNGRTYLTGGDFSIWLFDQKTKMPKLAAFVYTHRANKTADGRYEGYYDQGPNNWVAWSDINGNGKMALNEFSYTQNVALMKKVSRLFAWSLQKDLSILMLGPDWVVRRLSARKVTPDGVPVYDWADLQDVVTLHTPDLKGGDGWKKLVYTLPFDLRWQDGSIYSFAKPESVVPLHLPGIDGDGWWASRNWRQTPLRFDVKTGRPAWLKLGRRASGLAQAGQMYFPLNLAGVVDGFVFVPDALNQMWVWTDSGLYIGKLYRDPPSLDADSLHVEETGAYVYKLGGKVYAFAGDHGVSVHQVDLPKLINVDAGPININESMVAAARRWDPDGPIPDKKPVYIARSLFDLAAGKQVRVINVDGNLEEQEWADVPPTTIKMDDQKRAEVRVAFDDKNLYLAYRVQDPNSLHNAGTELPYAPFVSGSYVDFSIGRDWSESQREKIKEGDMRVIMARITGVTSSDYQMGFWPLKKGGLNPQVISSPAASRQFDDISPVPGLKFAYKITPEGYTLEASVPLQALDIQPTRNPLVGFDASVGFADKSGRIRTQAIHWAGQSEATVVDRPGSSELKPSTWGTLYFDRSPLVQALH